MTMTMRSDLRRQQAKYWGFFFGLVLVQRLCIQYWSFFFFDKHLSPLCWFVLLLLCRLYCGLVFSTFSARMWPWVWFLILYVGIFFFLESVGGFALLRLPWAWQYVGRELKSSPYNMCVCNIITLSIHYKLNIITLFIKRMNITKVCYYHLYVK